MTGQGYTKNSGESAYKMKRQDSPIIIKWNQKLVQDKDNNRAFSKTHQDKRKRYVYNTLCVPLPNIITLDLVC